MLVLVFHSTEKLPAVEWLTTHVIGFGRLGVLMLILQGGYLVPRMMVRINHPVSFWMSRATRFYPAYWITLLGFVLVLWVTGERVPDLPTTLLNATYFPELLGAPFLMGSIWTMAIVFACYGAVTLGILTLPHTALEAGRRRLGPSQRTLLSRYGPWPRSSSARFRPLRLSCRDDPARGARGKAPLAIDGACAPDGTLSRPSHAPGIVRTELSRGTFFYVAVPVFVVVGIQIPMARWNPKLPQAPRSLGAMSYSIYLAQAPTLLFFQHLPTTLPVVVLRTASSLVARFLLYRLIEIPSIGWSCRLSRRA